MKKLHIFFMTLVLALAFTACSDSDVPSGETIFSTEAPQRDDFDKWLVKNYVNPYNVDFQYKWQHIESSMGYTLTPADSARSAKLAIIIKYLWFDAYNEVISQEFLKSNAPRQITLIGSPAYNSNGTMILGTAEGGYKVQLYMVNQLTAEMLSNYDRMSEYYFNTMHHEFMHILNQKKPYDPQYNLISEDDYVSGDWYQVAESEALSKGFVRDYAMAEGSEDFAETYCQFVCNTDEEWQRKLTEAGDTGKAIILQKVELIRSYMLNSWGLDIDKLHAAVNSRGSKLSTLDLEHLK